MATVFRLREVMDAMPAVPGLRQLARDSGLSYNTVSTIYHNKAARADLATLDALASVLGCEPGELIGRQGKAARAGGRGARRRA